MADAPHILMQFPDRHRAYQEFVSPAESEGGKIFVPGEFPLGAREATLDVAIDEQAPVALRVQIEGHRRPSIRFAGGVFLRLSEAQLEEVRACLGNVAEADGYAVGRREVRHELRWPVVFRTPALLKPVQTRDISAAGMHVEMPERVRTGHICEFALVTPYDHKLAMAGEVVWTSEVSTGVGINFIFREETQRGFLRGFLSRAGQDAQKARSTDGLQPTAVILGLGDADTHALTAALADQHLTSVLIEREEEMLATVRKERPRLLVIAVDRIDHRDMVQTLRADVELKDTPIFLAGGREHEALVAEAREIKATAVLAMPFEENEVIALLARHPIPTS